MKEALNIVVTSSVDGISRIKLNEPSTYNALSSKMLKSLINTFKSLNNENKTKVIIIEGSGKGWPWFKRNAFLKREIKIQKFV